MGSRVKHEERDPQREKKENNEGRRSSVRTDVNIIFKETKKGATTRRTKISNQTYMSVNKTCTRMILLSVLLVVVVLVTDSSLQKLSLLIEDDEEWWRGNEPSFRKPVG